MLRLPAYELIHRPDVPYRVVLNEAIEIAKRFGSEHGHTYVNGVLDHAADWRGIQRGQVMNAAPGQVSADRLDLRISQNADPHPRAQARGGVVLGIGDDAALLQVPPGQQLVVTADTLNAGVHFPRDTAPADIGWKSLAVNLSDLAAMGAVPAWCTLSLSLPQADQIGGRFSGRISRPCRSTRASDWWAATPRAGRFRFGHRDGLVESGGALRRDRRAAGDDMWVTGTLGDAAAALEALLRRCAKFRSRCASVWTGRRRASLLGRRLSGIGACMHRYFRRFARRSWRISARTAAWARR